MRLRNVPIYEYTFPLDGTYYQANGGVFPANDQGQRFIAPFDLEIIDAGIYNKTQGSGGQTELDLKKSTSGSGVWTSIFGTTPKVLSTASGNAWCFVGQVIVGFVAAVLGTGKTMLKGQALRCDIITVQTGTPDDAAITIRYKRL